MAKNFVWDYDGLSELLDLADLIQILEDAGKKVAEKAESLQDTGHAHSTYEVESGHEGGAKRDRAYVWVTEKSPDAESAFFNAVDHTLARALYGD